MLCEWYVLTLSLFPVSLLFIYLIFGGSVSYDIYTESKTAHDSLMAAFASKITCGENCSAAFSADFRSNMQRNNVDSDLIDSIQADSSASVQESAKDQPTENQSSTPSSQADDQIQADNASEGTTGADNWIVYVVAGGLVAIAVLIAVVMVVRSRLCRYILCRRIRCPRKEGKMRLAEETSDQTFSKRSVVEMQHTNPMKKPQAGAAIGIVKNVKDPHKRVQEILLKKNKKKQKDSAKKLQGKQKEFQPNSISIEMTEGKQHVREDKDVVI